jgi:hypothetical protein
VLTTLAAILRTTLSPLFSILLNSTKEQQQIARIVLATHSVSYDNVIVLLLGRGGGGRMYFHGAPKLLLVALHIGSVDFDLCSGSCTLHQIEHSKPFRFHLFYIQS